jgi:hypothetical protein
MISQALKILSVSLLLVFPGARLLADVPQITPQLFPIKFVQFKNPSTTPVEFRTSTDPKMVLIVKAEYHLKGTTWFIRVDKDRQTLYYTFRRLYPSMPPYTFDEQVHQKIYKSEGGSTVKLPN